MSRFLSAVCVLVLVSGCGASDGISDALSMSIDNFCDMVVVCDSSVTTAECRAAILGSIGSGGTETCENAAAVWVNCIADLECQQILDELNQINLCESEFNAAEAICN